jgi:hypothetical protein
MRKGNALCSAYTVVSAVEFAARQIGPICAWSSGNVVRVMTEHIGGYTRGCHRMADHAVLSAAELEAELGRPVADAADARLVIPDVPHRSVCIASRAGRLPQRHLRGWRGVFRDRLPGGGAEHFGMGPAVVLGQDLAEGAGPVRDSPVADLATGDRKMDNGHRKAAGMRLAHHLYRASPVAVALPCAGAARAACREWACQREALGCQTTFPASGPGWMSTTALAR